MGRFILCLTLVAGILHAQTPDQRPNILFIFTDDHAPHAISAYGSKINQTPNIDRIAQAGVTFDRCYCGNSICAPSRATVLTGLHSHRHGVVDNSVTFDGDQVTFPKLLRKAGYQTAIVGKWHLKSDPTGFDFWEVLIGQGPYYNPRLMTPEGVVPHVGYTTDIITDRTLRWLKEQRDPNRPFLMMCQHKAPHREWQPDAKHYDLFEEQTIPEPPTLFDDYKNRASPAPQQEMTVRDHLTDLDLKLVPPARLTAEQLKAWKAAYEPRNAAFREQNLTGEALVRWKYQRYIKDYLRCIASVDENIGRILDWLDESGLASNTIVVYSSDQGFYLGDHGWYDKRWMYEESYRMPLIVRWPQVTPPGTRSQGLAQNIDFAPTFLEAAGVTPPPDMQGRSLVPLLNGTVPPDWRQALYYHYWEFPGEHAVPRHRGVSTARHKLIDYYQLGERELFDLETDPHEMNNVIADPAYREVLQTLEAELQRLREHYGDVDPDALPDGAGFPEELVFRGSPGDVERTMADNAPDCANRSFAVGARVQGATKGGVIASQGGERFGWCLALQGSIPVFTLRNAGTVYRVRARSPIDGKTPVRITGLLDHRRILRLLVDGKEVGRSAAAWLDRRPAEPVAFGQDTGSAVDPDSTKTPFDGELLEIGMWWGEPRDPLR